MWRKREIGRYRYTIPDYKSVTYTANVNGGTISLTGFLNELHDIQLQCIDEAVEKSDLRDAKEIIKAIMEKK